MVVGFSRKDFLEALFGQYFRKRDGFLIVKAVRTGDQRISTRFFPNIEILSRESYDESQNVFFGVCPRETMKSDGADVRYVTAVWAGLDLGPDGYSGRKAYFPDNRQIARAVRSFPLNPSIIVESGTGMHLYWLLRTVTQIDDAQAVEEQLNKVNNYFQCKIEMKLNSTLRLPETVNSKMPGQGLRCSVKFINPDFRYDLADFVKLNLLSSAGSISRVSSVPTQEDAAAERSTASRRPSNQVAVDQSEQLASYFSEGPSGNNHFQPIASLSHDKDGSAAAQGRDLRALDSDDIEPLPYEAEVAEPPPAAQIPPEQASDPFVDRIVDKVIAKLADRISDKLVDQIVEKLARKLRKVSRETKS
jgi:hypothetical protein